MRPSRATTTAVTARLSRATTTAVTTVVTTAATTVVGTAATTTDDPPGVRRPASPWAGRRRASRTTGHLLGSGHAPPGDRHAGRRVAARRGVLVDLVHPARLDRQRAHAGVLRLRERLPAGRSLARAGLPDGPRHVGTPASERAALAGGGRRGRAVPRLHGPAVRPRARHLRPRAAAVPSRPWSSRSPGSSRSRCCATPGRVARELLAGDVGVPDDSDPPPPAP